MPESDARDDPDPRVEAAAARPDAFLSYAREDEAVAQRLCTGLEALGKRVWIDRERVEYSSSWKQRACAGIDAAMAVVVVLSRAWVTSSACRFEFEHARA